MEMILTNFLGFYQIYLYIVNFLMIIFNVYQNVHCLNHITFTLQLTPIRHNNVMLVKTDFNIILIKMIINFVLFLLNQLMKLYVEVLICEFCLMCVIHLIYVQQAGFFGNWHLNNHKLYNKNIFALTIALNLQI